MMDDKEEASAPVVADDKADNQAKSDKAEPVMEDKQEPECVVMGCNREICTSSDQPVVTACVVLPEHACYTTATCARQPDGECGWTESAELTTCVETARFNS